MKSVLFLILAFPWLTWAGPSEVTFRDETILPRILQTLLSNELETKCATLFDSSFVLIEAETSVLLGDDDLDPEVYTTVFYVMKKDRIMGQMRVEAFFQPWDSRAGLNFLQAPASLCN